MNGRKSGITICFSTENNDCEHRLDDAYRQHEVRCESHFQGKYVCIWRTREDERVWLCLVVNIIQRVKRKTTGRNMFLILIISISAPHQPRTERGRFARDFQVFGDRGTTREKDSHDVDLM
jgi:hypothetical protein